MRGLEATVRAVQSRAGEAEELGRTVVRHTVGAKEMDDGRPRRRTDVRGGSGTLAAGAAMNAGERPTGTLTLVFSDMEGSTRLARALGDGWPALLARHREVLREAVEAEGGAVVDCQGDSMFAVFRSAPAGVRAASEAQRRMAAERWPAGVVVRVRIGVHTGEPAPTADGGYAGVDVSHAARLCAAGHGGQVLLSESARLVSGADTISLGAAALPDIEPVAVVHQLVGDGLGREFPPLRTNAQPPPAGPRDLDARIDRAAESFEQRLNESIAGTIERAFQWSPEKKGPKGR